MMEIERPKIETAALSPDGRYGKFVVEPLERGFGVREGVCLLVTAVGMGVGVDISMLMRVHNIAMTVRVAMNMRVRMGVLERDRILNHYYGAHGHDS